MTQYDLWSATPNDSIVIFYTGDSLDYYFLHHERLAPNGKIYISSWHGGSQHLHVINHPDSLGLACGFQFNGQQCVTYNTNNLPNMVNYKLGALVGSGCDTVIATTSPQTPEGGLKDKIQVYPNPANEYFVVETNLINAEVSITDAQGSAIAKYKITNSKYEIDCTTWASGVYFWHLTNHTIATSNGKFMVVH